MVFLFSFLFLFFLFCFFYLKKSIKKIKRLVYKTGFLKTIAKFKKATGKKARSEARAKDLEPLLNFLSHWEARALTLAKLEHGLDVAHTGLICLHLAQSPGNQDQTH